IHDRMPAIIPPSAFKAWLDTVDNAPGDVAGLLKPAPDDLLEPVPVSGKVNRVSNDDPSLQERDVSADAPEEETAPLPVEDTGTDPQGNLF
ncbi:MAG: SOS response-associated peptidase family protein, partial [Hyphomicrobiales bacterium]|nr:SOS response-associated peptidase family protein [Hyphomicrobiales bacterium]